MSNRETGQAMTKIGKFWTDSVAYVALLAGAGLSIAGNVANVLRVRGEAVDNLDVVLAVAFPALVVLMVEVFVSSRWRGLPWPMQVLRWLGTLAIGAVAMRVSWVHLHELMVSRGQAGDVAALGPLAIDALAIMATALILAGRGRVQEPGHVDTAQGILANRQVDMDNLAARTAVVLPTPDEDVAITAAGQAMAEDVDNWLTGLASRVQDTTTTPAVPVVQGRAPRAAKGDIDATEAGELAFAGTVNGLKAGEIAEYLAGYYGVSTRTIRRQPWWSVVTIKEAP